MRITTPQQGITLGQTLSYIGMYTVVIAALGLWSERAYGPLHTQYDLYLVWKGEAAYKYGQRFSRQHYCHRFGKSFIKGFSYHGDPKDHPHMAYACMPIKETE